MIVRLLAASALALGLATAPLVAQAQVVAVLVCPGVALVDGVAQADHRHAVSGQPRAADDVGAHADGGEGLGGRAVARVDDDSDGGGGAYGRGAVTALPTPGSAATRSRMAEAARRR